MVLTYHEAEVMAAQMVAVATAAKVLRERAVADDDRLGAQVSVADAEWDDAITVSYLINGEILRLDGPPEVIAAAVLEAVGYADLLAEVERWEEYATTLAAALAIWPDLAALTAERDALAATLARVKVEGDRWANSKNYTSQFAGGLIREALRPPAEQEVDS